MALPSSRQRALQALRGNSERRDSAGNRNRPVKCIFRVFPFIETVPPWHETEERCDGGNESGGILAGACGTVACKRGLDSGVLPWAGDFGAGVSFLETGAPAP